MPSGIEHETCTTAGTVRLLPLIAASMPSGVEHWVHAFPILYTADRRFDAFGLSTEHLRDQNLPASIRGRSFGSVTRRFPSAQDEISDGVAFRQTASQLEAVAR
jgi:hypothetical protein